MPRRKPKSKKVKISLRWAVLVGVFVLIIWLANGLSNQFSSTSQAAVKKIYSTTEKPEEAVPVGWKVLDYLSFPKFPQYQWRIAEEPETKDRYLIASQLVCGNSKPPFGFGYTGIQSCSWSSYRYILGEKQQDQKLSEMFVDPDNYDGTPPEKTPVVDPVDTTPSTDSIWTDILTGLGSIFGGTQGTQDISDALPTPSSNIIDINDPSELPGYVNGTLTLPINDTLVYRLNCIDGTNLVGSAREIMAGCNPEIVPKRTRPIYCIFTPRAPECQEIPSVPEAKETYLDKLNKVFLAVKASFQGTVDQWTSIVAEYQAARSQIKATFPNKEGDRLFTAARSLNYISSVQKGLRDRSDSEDAEGQRALDEGLIVRNARTNESGYLPYQDSEFPYIYYYQCGPFDLLGTEAEIQRDCNKMQYRGGDINDIKLASYTYKRDDLIPLDIQTDNRKSFSNGIPPFVYKSGGYVYADDDDRINYLQINEDGTYSSDVATSKKYQGNLHSSWTYWDYRNSDTNPKGVWIRHAGYPVRQVFDVEITTDLIEDHPQIWYARQGDTLRFYSFNEDIDVEMVSQLISTDFTFAGDLHGDIQDINKLNQQKVIDIKSMRDNIWDQIVNLGATSFPDDLEIEKHLIGAFIDSKPSPVDPIKFYEGIEMRTHDRSYDYSVYLQAGMGQRVKIRTTREGNQGVLNLKNISFEPSERVTYSYIVPETRPASKSVTCNFGLPVGEEVPANQNPILYGRKYDYDCTIRKQTATSPTAFDER